MSYINLILIISICLSFLTQNAYAGYCKGYIPHIVSLETVQPKYLAYRDQWSAAMSPIVYIANNPSTPVNILSDLSKHRLIEVRMAVAKNPRIPSDVLETIFKDKSVNVRASALWNPAAEVKHFEYFLNQTDITYHEKLADCWNTPSHVIEKLYVKYSRDKSAVNDSRRNTLFGRIASNPNTPEWVLKEIFKLKSYFNIYLKIGENPKIVNEIITVGKGGSLGALREKYGLLPNDDFFERTITYILHRQAINPLLPDKVIFPVNLLINTDQMHPGYIMIRETYAKDESTPPAVITNLVKDVKGQMGKKQYNSSIHVIANPTLSKKELDEFCQSGDYQILMRVASNPNITPECIQTLTSEFIKDGKLNLQVKKDGKLDLRIKNDYEIYSGRRNIISSLLKNPSTPLNILYSTLDYAKQNYYEDDLLHTSITALLLRPEVPFNNLSIYIKNEDKNFIREYSTDEGDSISLRGMRLFVEYTQVLDRRLDKLETIMERKNFLEYASKSNSTILRAYAAGNRLTPTNVLEQLANDKSVLVKLELAKNINLSESIIRKLLNVKELIVFEEKNCSYE